MKYTYTAVITPNEDSTTWYCRVPDLPGCITTGKDLSDAIAMITEAASGWLCVAEDQGSKVYDPTPQADIPHDDRAVLTIIQIDTLAYRAATDTRAVRKNVSLPAWMAIMADKRKLSCSQILQEALMKVLGS